MALEFTNTKDKTGRYSALFTNTNHELVLEPEKEHKDAYQYIERFKPNEKFSFTIDNATIDTSLFKGSPEVTFTSTTPIVDAISAPDISSLMAELKELKARVNRTIALVHNCQKCGASLEVDEHKSIFCCKYCGATYLLGSVQPNSVYN